MGAARRTTELRETRTRAPAWAGAATRALAHAASKVRLIGTSTPRNLRSEIDRLAGRWRAGQEEAPGFVYEPAPDHGRLRDALLALGDDLDGKGPLGGLFAARSRELADEACICEGVGTRALWVAARRRYAARDEHDAGADALAHRWLQEGPATRAGGGAAASQGAARPCEDGPSAERRAGELTELVRSDDEHDPGSLLSRVRQELGRRRLPLRVMVTRDLASLAATGEGFVQIVADRRLTRRDVERTVLHELDGHVTPREAASRVPLGLFTVGTARGADDQEGRALYLEREAGFLDAGRRRELALRHIAARSVEREADFVATMRLLLAEGAGADDAARIGARAHRGGGLGREAVYLPALLRVGAALERDRALDRVLCAGRVAVCAASLLRPWTGDAEAAEA